ncbi:hypothetical protein WJX73_000170 [Symbiochloris irregularis]|uniref:Ubiquitin-like domain-containing protein n=1 Tax=Symbiochloris irregularis TaxID=706552 RepID=A0AAW1NUD7_9CHLO
MKIEAVLVQAGMGQPSFETGQQLVKLVIRNSNPSQPEAKQDFAVAVTSLSTVRQVKQVLERQYAGNPPPEAQTLIYAGRVLKNDQQPMSDVLNKSMDPEVPHTIHLVVKSPATASSCTATRAVPIGSPSPSSLPALAAGISTQDGASVAHASATPQSAGHQTNEAAGDPRSSMQGGTEQAFGNPYAHTSPALAAAYNAAFAALSAQGPMTFPDLSQLPPGSVPSAVGGQRSDPIPFNLNPSLGPNLLQPQQQQQQQQPHLLQHNLQQYQHALFHQNHAQGQAAGFLSAQFPTFSFPMPAAGVGLPHMRPSPASMPQHTGEASAASSGSSDEASTQLPSSISPNSAPSTQAAPAASGQQSQPFYASPAFAYVPVSLMPSMPLVSTSQPSQPPSTQQFAVVQQQQLLPGHQAVAFQAQLLVLAGILYQHCPPGRFMLIMGGAILMYLAGFAPFRVAMQRAMGIDPRRRGRVRGAGNTGVGGDMAAPAGVLQEIQSLLVGFFTSLLPGWNVNPEDAAAFAVAQQAAAAEAARPMQNAGRPHQD